MAKSCGGHIQSIPHVIQAVANLSSYSLGSQSASWRACDDFFWVGGDKTQAKPESPPTQKKAELRIVRVRVPPSDGTEARGGSLGRARMCVCVCGTLACELEYEVCSGRRLLRMLGFCIRIVTYLWEITRIPLE